MTGSGSSHDVVGELRFHNDGTVMMSVNQSSSIDSETLETFMMTSEFIFHALNRPDWMQEFYSDSYGKDERFPANRKKQEGPKLTLIVGGKED